MKYERCEHVGAKCPCIKCDKDCCKNYEDDEHNAIDTDILCEKARKYCESGREGSV